MLSRNLKYRLDRVDWDFAGSSSESPFSALHWHPARLPSQVAATMIGLLTNTADVVLDPFLGSGTTVVEAQRLGRSGIGFDLNPVSCLITAAKTIAKPASEIERFVEDLKNDARDRLANMTFDGGPRPVAPATVQEKWYSSKVLAELATLWAAINSYRGTKKVLTQMAFSACLLPVCRETRHWGYVCDNSTPKTDHEGDVLNEYCRLLDRLYGAYKERDADLASQMVQGPPPVVLRCEDSRQALTQVEKGSVKLLLTSPPYLGVSDYVKSQRLTMEWLGQEIEPIRQKEIGARSKRHRNSAHEDYMTEMLQVFTSARHALRPDGACVLILGESTRRPPYIEDFRHSLIKAGYRLAFSTTRLISQQRRQYNSIEAEHIIVGTPR